MQNRKYMKTLIVILCFGLLINSLPISSYAGLGNDTMNDNAPLVSPTLHWVSQYVDSLTTAGVIEVGEFSEDEYDMPITRGRFVDLFVKMLVHNNIVRERLPNDNMFDDISEDSPHYVSSHIANSIGLVQGYPDGTLRPDSLIERQELFAIVGRFIIAGNMLDITNRSEDMNATKFADDDSILDYAREYVYLLASNGVIFGYEDNTIRPFDNITCAEALAITERIHTSTYNSNSDMAKSNSTTESEQEQEESIETDDMNQDNSQSPDVVIVPSTPIGSGGSSSNSRNNNNANSNIVNVVETVSTSDNSVPYDYDDSVTADIDHILNLRNVKSIEFFTTFAPNSTITICSTKSMKAVIDILRGLKVTLSEPMVNKIIYGSGFTHMTLNYADGSSGRISFVRGVIAIYENDNNVSYRLNMTYDEVYQAEQQLISIPRSVNEQVANEMWPPWAFTY